MESLKGGGAEKVLLEILKHLNYSKYSVHLLLIVKEGIYINDLPANIGVNSLFQNRLHFRVVKKISKLFHTNLFFQKIINKSVCEKYDVELSFLEGPSLKFHSLIKSDTYKVTWVHCNLDIQRWWIKSFLSQQDAIEAYQKMDKIIFVSNDALRQFNKIFDIPSVNKQVFYNPINKQDILKKSNEFRVNKERFTICAIGRLGHQKAFHHIIKVASCLKEDNLEFEFWIIGSGPLKKPLQSLINRQNLTECVKLLGFKENPFPYLKIADLFISTSLTEGFPLAIAEAVCLGKAIVATSVTGTEEILDYGKFGVLTTHEDNDIYKAVKNLLLDNNLRKQYEINSAERSNMFDFNKSMKVFEEILDEAF